MLANPHARGRPKLPHSGSFSGGFVSARVGGGTSGGAVCITRMRDATQPVASFPHERGGWHFGGAVCITCKRNAIQQVFLAQELMTARVAGAPSDATNPTINLPAARAGA